MKEAVGKGLKWVILCGYVFRGVLYGNLKIADRYDVVRKTVLKVANF